VGPARPVLGAGIGAAFTDRSGGRSAAPYTSLNLGVAVGDAPDAVRGNRNDTATRLGLRQDRVVWMRQVHSANVAHVTAPFASDRPAADTVVTGTPGVDALVTAPPAVDAVVTDPPGVDAVVTGTPGLALAVLVADCAPILLADPVAGIVGAAHSGRPGTAAGIATALVGAMCERGADPARITAAIGPAICGSCYEVPAALRDEVAAVVPEAYSTTRDGTPGLDIRAGITAQLRAAGVGTIERDPRCTMESPELYSYRRDGRTGRFAGYVWLIP
jgi:polyphenol oxidase